MTAAELRTALIASRVMRPGYKLPLTYERTRGLRLSFLCAMRRVSDPARYELAARLCGEYIATMQQEFCPAPGEDTDALAPGNLKPGALARLNGVRLSSSLRALTRQM